MKIAFFSAKEFEKPYFLQANKEHELLFLNRALSTATVELARGCEAVCIFTNDDASAPVLEQLKALHIRCIAIRAAGFDQTDIRKANDLGIAVANVPEYSPYSIAEHAIAMIQALNRKLVIADKKIKDNNFALDELIGFDLNGKTVGIVGLGKIGGILAKILQGFGCTILGYDIQHNPQFEKDYGVKYVSFQELLSNADIISLHAPLNEHTKYMINRENIAQMKKGVMLINTSRGGLVNTQDVVDALKSGKIGHFGMDVYEKEKGLFFYNHSGEVLQDDLFARLLAFRNVLITGHQAFLTENALRNIAETTIYNLDCWSRLEKSKFELVK